MPKDFKTGVRYYTKGIASIEVNFPEDSVSCNWCQFCRCEQDLGRFWCRLTNKMIYNPYAGLADGCPICFEKIEDVVDLKD